MLCAGGPIFGALAATSPNQNEGNVFDATYRQNGVGLGDGAAPGHRSGIGLSLAAVGLLHAVLFDLPTDVRGGERLLVCPAPQLLDSPLLFDDGGAWRRHRFVAGADPRAGDDLFGAVSDLFDTGHACSGSGAWPG